MFNLNLTNHFQTYLLSTFIVPKFFKICNHCIINLKEKHHAFIMLFSTIFNLFSSTCVKKWTIFLKINFLIFYIMLSPDKGTGQCGVIGTSAYFTTTIVASLVELLGTTSNYN
jgi:hypothetical protein